MSQPYKDRSCTVSMVQPMTSTPPDEKEKLAERLLGRAKVEMGAGRTKNALAFEEAATAIRSLTEEVDELDKKLIEYAEAEQQQRDRAAALTEEVDKWEAVAVHNANLALKASARVGELEAALRSILQLTGSHDLVDAWKIAGHAIKVHEQLSQETAK